MKITKKGMWHVLEEDMALGESQWPAALLLDVQSLTMDR